MAEKSRSEVEVVRLASAVDEPYWLDAEVLELVVPGQSGNLGIKALTAKVPVATNGIAEADYLVTGHALATGFAAQFSGFAHLDCLRGVFPIGPAIETNPMQFTKFQMASITCLSEASGAI